MPFVTSTLRMWLHHWKRFVSIVAITMLGVAVLAGIHAGCQIMFHGANRFYNAQGLYDIQVVSTVGLTEADVDALRGVEGVQSVQPERSAMVSATIGGRSKSLTVSAIGTEGMNRPYLLEGELPSASGQVAVTRSFVKDSGLRVGDTFEVGAESKGGFPGGGIDATIETSAVPLANGGSEGSPGIRKDASPQGGDATAALRAPGSVMPMAASCSESRVRLASMDSWAWANRWERSSRSSSMRPRAAEASSA